MSSPKKNFIVDPDYEMTEVVRERVRLKEERENKDKIEQVKEIIEREFETELDHRQSQLELIEERLNQAQKTLHLLRYVLITSYYNENDKLISQLEDSSTNEEFSISNKDKLHPAVKKLLGKGSHDYKLNFTTTPRKKLKPSDNKDISKHANLISEPNNTITLDANTISNQTQSNATKEEFDTGRNRKKSKYRIVVGNISKWIPSHSEEDKSTHKWMVYVRGSKESPDISHFVQKVVFYLHPSYQPNDVIEIRDGPFHLARRGWGEFPLRVRIFFRCPLNKPVDIIHNLKLDKTFTGRQTLGNETVVSLLLYDNESKLDDTTEYSDIKEEPNVKSEDVCDPDQTEAIWDGIKTNIPTLNYEHDYCCSGIKQEVLGEEVADEYKYDSSLPSTSTHYSSYDHLSEHSYCVGNSPSQTDCAQEVEECISNEQDSDLMYGIKDTEESEVEVIEESVLNDLKVPTRQNNLQKYMMTNGTIIAIKKRKRPQESLLKKMFQKKYEKEITNPNQIGTVSILRKTYSKLENIKRSKTDDDCDFINYKKYKVEFPSHMFKNVSEALPYLFKRLPLITELVSDLDYKCTYPYAAKSLDEYSKWNIGKRLSSEWFQAKTILKYLNSSHLPDVKNWTTKSIIMYARSHGYTPLANYEIFKNKREHSVEHLNGIASNGSPAEDFNNKSHVELMEPDVLVDVVNCNPDIDPDESSNGKERLVDPNVEMGCSYVKQALLDVGIIIKPEEIIPGVLYNAAERLLFQAATCLAEDLIRRARANLVTQGNFREETSTVGIEEINKALSERTQFNVLLKTNNDE